MAVSWVSFVLCSFSILTAKAQSHVTLSGYVRDSSNGEELIGATVAVPSINGGVATNGYGFYSLTLPAGNYDIVVSYLGYTKIQEQIHLTADTTKNFSLQPEATVIQEVVVHDKPLDENVQGVQMSRNEVNVEQMRKLPAVLGEVDLLKTIQMLPGVISAGEGNASFFVRGGAADQNLILIDEAPVYDPSHLFGLLSVFNPDVIKESTLYKGGIPTRYGGRLSSVLEVWTKDGNNKKLTGTGGIGTLDARLSLEGPIRRDKSSFIVSARRSYADAFLKLAGQDNLVHFYDVNAKVNWRNNNNNRFFLALYAGHDGLSFQKSFKFGWGNTTGTFRWNHLFNNRLFANTSFILSNFGYALDFKDPVQGFNWTSNLQELGLKYDLSYFVNLHHEISFGYQLTGRQFAPGRISPNTEGSIFQTTELQKLYALDHALYASDAFKVSEKVILEYGARLSVFENVGKGDVFLYQDPQDNIDINRIGTLHFDPFQNIKTYVHLEPRVNLRYLVGPATSLKLSYNRMVQNTHLISNGTVPVPFDTWNPSGYYLRPEIADQVAAGYFRNFSDNSYEFSIEAYYKDMQDVVDFADNAQLLFNEDLSTEFRQGHSWSKGLEVMITKKAGRLTGTLSYTRSQTLRKIPGVNLNQAFPANYDRPNVLNIFGTYDLSDYWSFGATFTYSTGRPITLPAGKYEFDGYFPNVITERNGYRLPDFHHLDLSATFNSPKNEHRKVKRELVISIYNVYNRQNPFTIYTRTAQDKNGNVIGDGTVKEARMIYMFPILPSLTYNLSF